MAVRGRICLVVLLGAGVVAANAGAVRQTTAPLQFYKVSVSITDTAVIVARDKNTRGSLSRYARGAEIDFRFNNRGTQPYEAELLTTGQDSEAVSEKTKAIATGQIGHLEVNFYYRSTFALQALLNGKKHGTGAKIEVF